MKQYTIDDLLFFYQNEFIPAYADLIGYIGNKPQSILESFENILSHIMQYHNNGLNEEIKKDNVVKAYHHLQRATLDCYKLLWVEMNKRINRIIEDKQFWKFCINLTEAQLLQMHDGFKKSAQKARAIEAQNIGVDVQNSIEAYKDAIRNGSNIIDKIDETKVTDLERLKKKHSWKKSFRDISAAIIGGLAAVILVEAFGVLIGGIIALVIIIIIISGLLINYTVK